MNNSFKYNKSHKVSIQKIELIEIQDFANDVSKQLGKTIWRMIIWKHEEGSFVTNKNAISTHALP